MQRWFSRSSAFVDAGKPACLQWGMDTAPLVGRDAQPQSSDALLQDAVVASRVGDGDRALALLRSCVAQQHFNPTAHYLLGAEQAQRQAYGDAVVHMTTAIEQAPTLWVAR